MQLSAINAFLTRRIFQFVLLRRAYTRAALEAIVAASRCGPCEIIADGIGFELRLLKHGRVAPTTSTRTDDDFALDVMGRTVHR
jgi:hypothetical protein